MRKKRVCEFIGCYRESSFIINLHSGIDYRDFGTLSNPRFITFGRYLDIPLYEFHNEVTILFNNLESFGYTIDYDEDYGNDIFLIDTELYSLDDYYTASDMYNAIDFRFSDKGSYKGYVDIRKNNISGKYDFLKSYTLYSSDLESINKYFFNESTGNRF